MLGLSNRYIIGKPHVIAGIQVTGTGFSEFRANKILRYFLKKFQNSRVTSFTCYQLAIFNAIAENSSCRQHGETKDTKFYCMYASSSTYYL